MKALVFDRELQLADVPRPERAAGEALIRVLTAGICNTDIEITRGYMGFAGIPGHEFVGIVEEADSAHLTGKRVVGEINAGCGECERCRENDPRHCTNRTVLGIAGRNGAFAEYLTLPEENLLRVPDGLETRRAVFVEPLAAAVHVFDEPVYEPHCGVAVIGDGKLGLLVAMAGKADGYRITLFGRHPEKMRIAEDAGIRTVPPDGKTDERFCAIIECSGSPDGFRAALDLAGPQSTIILKSTFAADTEVDISRIVVDEISLIGSRCGRFQPALDLLERNQVDPEPMITAEYPFDEALAAFEHAQRSDALKILLKISGE